MKLVQRALLKLLPTFLCLDVYVHWLRLFRFYSAADIHSSARSILDDDRQWHLDHGVSFIWPYDRHGSIILMEAIGNAAYWIAIIIAARLCGLTRPAQQVEKAHASSSPSVIDVASPPASVAVPPPVTLDSSPSLSPSLHLLSALLLSSFLKLFLILPLVWSPEYAANIDVATQAIKIGVIISNAQACGVLLALSSTRALMLVLVGVGARMMTLGCVRTYLDPAIAPYHMW